MTSTLNSHKIINPLAKMVIHSGNVTFDINPFNTALLKTALRLTCPKVVRKYIKNQKTVAPVVVTNPPSYSNDKSVVDSTVGKFDIISEENIVPVKCSNISTAG